MGQIDLLASRTACPSDAELVDFSRGQVAAALAEAIEQHLSECTRCAASLASLAEADSMIVRTLRHSLREPIADPYGADPECQRMTQRAKRLLADSDPVSPDAAAGVGEPALPCTIGQYQLVAKIGEGGMGSVYRALHMRLKKPVAVKVLRTDRTADRQAVARFQREMEAIGRLDHVHIVRATDAGEAGGVHFLAMELLDGVNLARLVSLAGPIGAADASAMIRQAALGLQCAYEHQLVHRDIKPSNLLLSARGEIKVLDLGLARLQEETEPAEELTASHHILGTGDYMAPEQWQASHAVDIRADIYSLGCTLFYLLTGAAPFGGQGRRTPQQKMSAHRHADLPLQALDASAPRGLRSVLERMLAKDPAARFAEPAELATALAPLCAGAELATLARRALARQAQSQAGGSVLGTADSTGGAAATPRDFASGTVTPRDRTWRGRRLGLVAAGCAMVIAVAWLAAPHFVPRPSEAPPEPRTFAAGVWHDLLDRPPVKWHWFDPYRNSHAFYDADVKRFRLQSSGTSLFSLGRASSPGFILRLSVRQEQWTGGVGVFFAGHKDPVTQKLTFEYVELRRGATLGSLVLQRTRGSIQPREGQVPLRIDVGVDSWPLPRPPGPREYPLEISVEHAGLARIAWDGVLCEKLIDRVGRAAPGEQYQGEFGLFSQTCSAHLTRAEFLPTE